MTEAHSVPAEPSVPNWPVITSERIKADGPFATLAWLHEEIVKSPDDLALRGYIEIVRALVVKDLLAHPLGLRAMPRLSPEFLIDFAKFNLSAKEGYLISLIDGRTNIEKLLKLSPFDPFTTLFNLASMQNQKAIVVTQ